MVYDFVIEYRKEFENKVVDALSRMNEDFDPILFTLTFIPIIDLLSHILESYKSDLVIVQLYEKIFIGKNGPKYTMRDGGLYYKWMVYVPNNEKIKNYLLELLHSSPLGGHLSYNKTLYRVPESSIDLGLKLMFVFC